MRSPERKRVVLIGAGHAHLYVASRAQRFRKLGIELVLVDPGVFWYSGLATGMLGGMYDREQDLVDPRPLTERCGGRFLRDRLVALDRERRTALLQSGVELGFDALSLNVGSEVAVDPAFTRPANVWTVKPICNLWGLRRQLEQGLASQREGRRARVVVVGGGASGCEIAANIEALARRNGAALQVTLVSAEQRLLPDQRATVSARLARCLEEREIRVELRCPIEAVEERLAVAADGRRFAWDALVLATGLQSPRWLKDLGLELDERGGLAVDASLRSVGDRSVFGVGDCIGFAGAQLPKLGVYAVRQAPVLLHNLLAIVTGTELRPYRPQRRALSILNLGRGSALAIWGPMYWHGNLSLRLKDVIDRRFLARYRRLGE